MQSPLLSAYSSTNMFLCTVIQKYMVIVRQCSSDSPFIQRFMGFVMQPQLKFSTSSQPESLHVLLVFDLVFAMMDSSFV